MGQGSSIAVSCGVGLRCDLDPTLLWLWQRLAAVAPIGSLALELPNATGVALKSKKKKKNQKVLGAGAWGGVGEVREVIDTPGKEVIESLKQNRNQWLCSPTSPAAIIPVILENSPLSISLLS